MIRAIIFDCFGVLTTDSWGPFRRKHFGHNPQLMEDVSEKFRRVDAGLARYEDFLKEIATIGSFSVEEARAELDKNVADDELFVYLKRELKPHYKIGMLSNAGENWLPQLFSEDQIALFDTVALSYETGFVKPDPRAYEDIARRLDVEPEECIFIDDQERYCTAAREAGMQAVVYTSFEQLQAELSPLLQKA
jgi:HAD superfamily hydrolase (TIGR01509 family)